MRSRQSKKCSLEDIVCNIISKAKSQSLPRRASARSTSKPLYLLPLLTIGQQQHYNQQQAVSPAKKALDSSRFDQWLLSTPQMGSRLFENTPTSLHSSRFNKLITAKRTIMANQERQATQCNTLGACLTSRRHLSKGESLISPREKPKTTNNQITIQSKSPKSPSQTTPQFFTTHSSRNITLKVNNNYITLSDTSKVPKWRRRKSLYLTFYK